MQRRTPSGLSSVLGWKLAAASLLAAAVASSGGCAGVKPNGTGTAGTSGGGTGGVVMPPIDGLTSLSITVSATNVTLTQDANGDLSGQVTFTATGVVNGSSQDVTSMVSWNTGGLASIQFGTSGNAVITAPGSYQISAFSGSIISNSVTVVAQFNGTFTGSSFDTSQQSTLDGNASGSSTLAYPLDHSLFPGNLGPIDVQIAAAGTSGRLHFTATGVDVTYYDICQTGVPGTGCDIQLPLSVAKLFIAASEAEDINLTARVMSGSTVSETNTINVAWAQTQLTGGLYFWTTIPPPTAKVCPVAMTADPGTYCLLDTPAANATPTGTSIYRYDFSATNPAPQQIWTDDGGPNSVPAYQGAPQSWDAGMAGGHCIGCHAITSDGLFMGLTLGGSSSTNGANWSLLDIANQALLPVNPPAAGIPDTNTDTTASPTMDPTNYWKSFRNEGFATETSWGPPPTDGSGNYVAVTMYQTKLYLATVGTGTTIPTATRPTTPILPSWSTSEHLSDPYWSQDGTLLAFTSFNQVDPVDNSNNPGGLNGDEKTGGEIGIATATPTGINDDAKVLVSRSSGVSSYYPTISADSQFVVFSQSTCGSGVDPLKMSTDYGAGTCDGYDDSSAQLWILSAQGGATHNLTKANGTGALGNSWPRFSPDVGSFRGQNLYWVAFSSRRAYGTQVNTGALTTTHPQLWFAGVNIGGEFSAPDPSFAPVWLPGQNPVPTAPNGNHVPQWVKVAIKIN